jgi:hypothetical protein
MFSCKTSSGLTQCLLAVTVLALLGFSVHATGETTGSAVGPVAATPGAGQLRWSALSAQQQRDLQPLQKEWSGLTASRQQKWLEVAARMPFMTVDERERVRERMFEWARMSPAQRGQARLQFQEVRQWPTEDRQAQWEAYLALTDDERTALAGQARRDSLQAAAAGGKPALSAADLQKKHTVVAPAQSLSTRKTVAHTVVQIKPGATTQLVSRALAPPAHQQPGMPKIAANEKFVDPLTLLPRRGPQAAAMAGAEADPTLSP